MSASSTASRLMSSRLHPSLKGVFGGAGADINEPAICREIIKLTGKEANVSAIKIAYLGTATYDLPSGQVRQTSQLSDMGCNVIRLPLSEYNGAWPSSSVEQESKQLIRDDADVVIVSGGNTLYAMDTWKQLGVDIELRKAMERGAVLAGGSAGAICWFESGHSDSADPETFRDAMLAAASGAESSSAPTDGASVKDWRYIRVAGLGYLPGFMCPHYDKTQSNGVLRAIDMDGMLKRHRGERGLGLDHFAVLICDGDSYRVVSAGENKGGSVGDPADGDFAFVGDQAGKPGLWVLEVTDEEKDSNTTGGVVKRTLAPYSGKLSELLRLPTDLVEDPLCEDCRQRNPVDKPPQTESTSGLHDALARSGW